MEFDKASGVYGLRFKSETTPGASIFLPCLKMEEKSSNKEEYVTETTRRLHGYYWTKDPSDNSDNSDNAYALHFSFQHTERYKNDNLVSVTEFEPAINNGKSLYRFADTLKTKSFPVRAILK